ncbi:EF-P lysine aminoacylase GenX [Methylovirgula ligni]|uniref:Lysyl-tRNA synthetase class 2 n=1 Tax=Methylovirgula ligni TaxID=569860 RepID=A0A3D9Z2V9_9HYPH|nr:EF-P lysine aminoacylase EpmA [Methylovirgula ligni]QAY95204.1 EF-P lysine aminoacylase GenX [Methylovirgula ligni]REF89504.1 lysyl-tRNA synthetase class 2 [Methylovirgula ligni]
MSKPSFWPAADSGTGHRPALRARAALTKAVRAWFDADGFIEADTPILQVSPGNETHISAFATELIGPAGEKSRLYLHSSPEFALKKLLAAGEEKIFSLGHVFRNRERGPLHHPEFTMLEWYRAKAPYEALYADCAALLATAAEAAGTRTFRFREAVADAFATPEILSVAEAFRLYGGFDLLETYNAQGCDRDALARHTATLGLRVADDDTWSDLFSKILSAKIEPRLGHGRATLLVDYPAPEAALARLKDDRRFAERFELYVCGVELANGFGELTDAAEQRRRFAAAMDERRRIYGDAYPIDEDFLAALAAMPPSSGIALGFDRLVMLATGSKRIEDVLWAPVAETGTPR